jgi:hypothetical protein
MSDIVYFEIPADDLARASRFYSEVFGWEMDQGHDQDYLMIKTGNEEAVGGGLMKRVHPQQTVTDYIDVESIDECAPQIEKAGGKLIVPKTAVSGMGYFSIFQDTEKNVFGIWETDETAQ